MKCSLTQVSISRVDDRCRQGAHMHGFRTACASRAQFLCAFSICMFVCIILKDFYNTARLQGHERHVAPIHPCHCVWTERMHARSVREVGTTIYFLFFFSHLSSKRDVAEFYRGGGGALLTLVDWPDLCMCLNVVHSQSSPSYNPSPLVATVPCTCHVRSRSCETPSCSHTSAGLSAPFMSCLLAKMRIAELRISGSDTIVLNSFDALEVHTHFVGGRAHRHDDKFEHAYAYITSARSTHAWHDKFIRSSSSHTTEITRPVCHHRAAVHLSGVMFHTFQRVLCRVSRPHR